MHIVFVYIEAEMHILHVIQLILLFPFVCEAVGEAEWKRGPELPHLTLTVNKSVLSASLYKTFLSFLNQGNDTAVITRNTSRNTL